MSELARQRSARDIWISKGHLYAMGVGLALAVVAAFAAGYGAGRQSVELPPPSSIRLTGDASDGSLVELLARVDATATPDGGVLELTFPDALAGEAPALAAEAVAEQEPTASVAAGEGELPEAADLPPAGRWTVSAVALPSREDADRVAADLKARELEAWVGVEALEGQTRYRVAIGGWGSRVEAERALPGLQAAIEAAGGRADVVRY
jgi:cell division septation protein DedD